MTFFTSGTDYTLPNYGNASFWTTRFSAVTGAVNWSSSAGSALGPSRSNDITVQSGQVHVQIKPSLLNPLLQPAHSIIMIRSIPMDCWMLLPLDIIKVG